MTPVRPIGAVRKLLADAIRADRAMRRTGTAYDARDVHQYLEARIQGRYARRPLPVRWRL